MPKVRFRNGADAPEIVLDEEVAAGSGSKHKLDEIVARYGTVPDAAAWLDGDKPPKHLSDPAPEPVKVEEPLPEGEPDPRIGVNRDPSDEPRDVADDDDSDEKAEKPEKPAHRASGRTGH